MSLLSKVTRCMRTIAPLELAESSWDNVGVLVGKMKTRKSRSKQRINSHYKQILIN
jgi:putative NIF3 family GTP cyclohydrolase 1 type 2